MSLKPSPRQVADQWFQRVWNDHDEAAIAELMAADARGQLEGGVQLAGRDHFIEFFRGLLSTFPDIGVRVLDIVEEGEKAFIRWEATGTHQGDGMGVKATRAPHSFSGMTWLLVRDGQIVDGGDSWNQAGLVARMAAAQ